MDKRALADEEIQKRIEQIKQMREYGLGWGKIAEKLFLHRDTLRDFRRKYLSELK